MLDGVVFGFDQQMAAVVGERCDQDQSSYTHLKKKNVTVLS